MAVQNSLARQDQSMKLSVYLQNDAVKKQINQVVGGKNGTRFISSIVSAVQSTPALQECTSPSIVMTRIEGDNLQEKRSRKEQRMDRQQHYEELESRHDAKALERFRRPAYQSVSVAEYLARKYDITAEVDTGGQGHFDCVRRYERRDKGSAPEN